MRESSATCSYIFGTVFMAVVTFVLRAISRCICYLFFAPRNSARLLFIKRRLECERKRAEKRVKRPEGYEIFSPTSTSTSPVNWLGPLLFPLARSARAAWGKLSGEYKWVLPVLIYPYVFANSGRTCPETRWRPSPRKSDAPLFLYAAFPALVLAPPMQIRNNDDSH